MIETLLITVLLNMVPPDSQKESISVCLSAIEEQYGKPVSEAMHRTDVSLRCKFMSPDRRITITL